MRSTIATRSNAGGGTSDRNFARNRILVILAAIAVLAGSYAYAPMVHQGPVICPLHGVVGLPCPSCGLTRAFCALAHLEIWQAIHYNALSLPLFLAFVVAPPVALYECLAGRRSRLHAALFSTPTAYVLGAVVVAYHLTRTGVWLLDGTLCRDYLTTSWTYVLLHGAGLV
jgi:hypothetical protein